MVKEIPKNVVVILVIVAVVLAGLVIAFNVYGVGEEKVSLDSGALGENDVEGGKIGIEVLPPIIEDKLAETSGGEPN